MKSTLQSPILDKWVNKIPLAATLLLVFIGGLYLLDKADKEARDITRKHHLEDIEQSLYFARNLKGTFPPYEQSAWCGLLNAEENREVRLQVEQALRAHNKQYANENKPFPTDPLYIEAGYDYFYWKHSPAMFELYAILEQNKNGERNTLACDNAPKLYYDYGLNSVQRQKRNPLAL